MIKDKLKKESIIRADPIQRHLNYLQNLKKTATVKLQRRNVQTRTNFLIDSTRMQI